MPEHLHIRGQRFGSHFLTHITKRDCSQTQLKSQNSVTVQICKGIYRNQPQNHVLASLTFKIFDFSYTNFGFFIFGPEALFL